MWVWTLNWGEVRDDLIVGSCPMTTNDIDLIQSGTGATALMSVQCDDCRSAFGIDLDAHLLHAKRRGLALANAPMRDFDVDDQRRNLADTVVCLTRLLSAGHRVYVYCTAGINRAPLSVLAYLTFVEGLSADDALQMIRAGRPQADPYWEAWHGARSDLLQLNHDAVELRAWDRSQRDPNAPPEDNWFCAETEVIREVLLATAATPDLRRDPHRA